MKPDLSKLLRSRPAIYTLICLAVVLLSGAWLSYPAYEKYRFNSAVDDLLNGAKCSKDMFPNDLTYYEIYDLWSKISDETYARSDEKASNFNKRVFIKADNTIFEYYNTARRKRAIDYLLDRSRKSEDLFTRDMDIQELRNTYYNTKDRIYISYIAYNYRKDRIYTSTSEKVDIQKNAHDKLFQYYNTARAELGLPPID